MGQYPRSAGWTKYREKEIELEKLKMEKSDIEETLKLKISKLEEELKSRKGILPKSARRLKCVGVHFLIFVTSSRDESRNFGYPEKAEKNQWNFCGKVSGRFSNFFNW